MKRLWIGLVFFMFLAALSAYVFIDHDSEADADKLGHPQVGETAAGESKPKDPFQSTDGKIIDKRQISTDAAFRKKVELFQIRYMSEGVEVAGFLAKPRKVKQPLPVIIYNRGGIVDSSQIGEKTLKHIVKLSSRGYVVAASQYRGYGSSAGTRDIAGKDVQDVINLITLVESLPYAAGDQKVMLGFSRGGMMTYMAIREGADIRAAAVVGGVTDLTDLYKHSGDAFQNPLNRWVGDPLLDEEEYIKRSAVEWSEKLKVPLLLMHGLGDRTVSPEQSQRLAEQLTRLGYEHRLVLIPGGSHYLYSHPDRRDQEILNWFAQYLP